VYGTPFRQAAPRSCAKELAVIRVRVPLDLHAVSTCGSAAFALATPLRVRDLLALAVREAIGYRAPHDKFQRSMLRTLAGLAAGDFTLDIDGREFADSEAVVVCEGSVCVRFFTNRSRHAGLELQP
jgi:hypothetical protein